MAGKLDQSLDEILSTQRRSARRGGRGRRGGATSGPTRTTRNSAGGGAVGGIIKNSARPARNVAKGMVPTGPAAGTGDSKIIVSNLPSDVNEAQIKDYFSKAVGPIKKCLLTYGPNGLSRGVATIVFTKADAANRAIQQNGLLVDGKPLKIEVVVDASKASVAAPIKGLGERIAQPKNQPKSSLPKNSGNNATNTRGTGRARGGRGQRRGRNAGRAKPKTADELDAEMADYFEADGGNNNNNVNGGAGGAVNAGGPVDGGAQAAPAVVGGGANGADAGDDMDTIL
ncbi:MAG: hypothetical protein M1823_001876 [Watsoniomyces obsoletus]|nr:MAG: hypothetical protein M1823_001876 [Watsoniomyces obsoletus]